MQAGSDDRFREGLGRDQGFGWGGEGPGFRVWRLGFRIWGLGFRGLGFGV